MNCIDLQDKIKLVKEDILNRFPNCSYTISILIWDDGTDMVECRHGSLDGKKIFKSIFYCDNLSFEEIDVDNKVMIKDEFGNEYFKYLVDFSI